MKLWRRFKYELLKWLLNDICLKSGECKKCYMSWDHMCAENFVFKQARMVWGLEEKND